MRNTPEQPINIAWNVSMCDLWTLPVLFSCVPVPAFLEAGETDGIGRCKGYSEVLIGVLWCAMSSRVIVHLLQRTIFHVVAVQDSENNFNGKGVSEEPLQNAMSSMCSCRHHVSQSMQHVFVRDRI